MNIANRDIKLENALLDSNNSPWPLLRLCDFGYSINETMSLAQSRVGTQVSCGHAAAALLHLLYLNMCRTETFR